jgi:hypothetical protein
MEMNPESWNLLFQKYNLYDASDSTTLNLSSPDFVFLVKDLLDLRDEMNASLEEAGAVAKRLLALPYWEEKKEGAKVQKVIRAEAFIQVSQ